MQNNNAEEKNNIKETLVSNAVIIFLIPIIAYILSYAYNLGYNSYFSIPTYLTSLSFTPILSNFLSLLSILLCILFVLYLFILMNHIYKSANKPLSNLFPRKLYYCITSLFLLACLIWYIKIRLIPAVIMFSIIIIFQVYIYIMDSKVTKLIKELESLDGESITPEKLIELNNRKDKLTKKLKIPFIKTFTILSFIISFFLVLFVLMSILGVYNASHQKIFYSINDNSIIINTLNDNYISVPVYKINSDYYYKTEYTIKPMNETTIKQISINNLKHE